MLNERQFVRAINSFWRDTLPYCEIYVRYLYAEYASAFDTGFNSSVDPDRRSLVNELAFTIYCASINAESLDAVIGSRHDVEALYAATVQRMRQFAEYGPKLVPLSNVERDESIQLARRTNEFFSSRYGDLDILVRPVFPGCAMLTEVEADVFVGGTLFEIKAGKRAYRGVDLKQLLTYCALNYGTGSHEIERVGLLNPRLGTYLLRA